jgi:hypothetical protein
VLLVIVYFILVKSVEMPDTQTHIVVPSAENETFWVLIIFIGYFAWDVLTKAVTPDPAIQPTPSFWQRLFREPFVSRGGVTLLCVGFALLLRCLLRHASSQGSVVLADFSLLSLVVFFRALNQQVRRGLIMSLIALIIFTGLAVR